MLRIRPQEVYGANPGQNRPAKGKNLNPGPNLRWKIVAPNPHSPERAIFVGWSLKKRMERSFAVAMMESVEEGWPASTLL